MVGTYAGLACEVTAGQQHNLLLGCPPVPPTAHNPSHTPAPKHTSDGRLNSSCGSCGQNSWLTMVALRPSVLTRWRRRRRGVALLGTDCTLALVRLESARSWFGGGREVESGWGGAGQVAWGGFAGLPEGGGYRWIGLGWVGWDWVGGADWGRAASPPICTPNTTSKQALSLQPAPTPCYRTSP